MAVCQRVCIVIPKTDCAPLCNIRDVYAHQTAATIEGIITNARHAVSNCNTCQTTAAGEGPVANARHAVRNSYVRQTTATIEGILIDFCYIRR